jgi:mRNA-degrading endonuclease RelE of RelBE toxin-antitoxin system
MPGYRLEVSKEAKFVFKRISRKDKPLLERIEYQLAKILEHPELGKPLRYGMKNQRRVHIGSFVLSYEIENDIIRVLDFDHHDRVYKKKH